MARLPALALAALCCLPHPAGARAGGREGRGLLRAAAPPRHAAAAEAPGLGAPAGTPGDAIPSVIYFTGPWEPKQVVRRSERAVAKGTEFRYYNYSELERSVDEISASLEEAGVPGASRAFHGLRPRAFRADLWRLMVLWQNGGVYVDAKMALRAPLSAWVDQAHDSFVACYDRRPEGAYWNAMLAARRHNPTLLALIRRIISNVDQRYYPPGPLAGAGSMNITGPGMLTSVLRGLPPEERPRVSCRLAVTQGRAQVLRGARLIPSNEITPQDVVAEADDRVHQRMKTCKDCDKYQVLFSQHSVYCSEPGPMCRFSLLALPATKGYWSYVV